MTAFAAVTLLKMWIRVLLIPTIWRLLRSTDQPLFCMMVFTCNMNTTGQWKIWCCSICTKLTYRPLVINYLIYYNVFVYTSEIENGFAIQDTDVQSYETEQVELSCKASIYAFKYLRCVYIGELCFIFGTRGHWVYLLFLWCN